MKQLRLAYDNLRFNKYQTIMSMLVISIAVTSILLFRGYTNYTLKTLKTSFIERTGDLQIAHKDFWQDNTEIKPLLNGQDKNIISKILDDTEQINSYQELLSLSGIIGTAYRSRFFSGDAYEIYPNSIYKSFTDRSSVENGIFIGEGLADYLMVKSGEFVSLLGQGKNGLAFISLPVEGKVHTKSRDVDNILGIMNLDTARSFYGMSDEFDRLRIDLNDSKALNLVVRELNNKLRETSYEVKDWLYINPIFMEINNINRNTALWMSVIFMLFVIVSITQMLQMNYFQRMKELGTLQAIGLTPQKVFVLLFFETFLLALFSIISGIVLTYSASFIINIMKLTFTPPMATDPYLIQMLFYPKDFLVTALGVSAVVILSGIYPAYRAVSKPIIEVIKHD